MCCFIMTLFPPAFLMSLNVYLCIVSSIRIANCFVRIAIRIVSVFSVSTQLSKYTGVSQ